MKRTGAASVAVIVPTPDLLKQMLREKPPCWAWAAFASVLFQRWAAVEERKVCQVLGSPVRPTGSLRTEREVALFVRSHLRDADDVILDVGRLLRAPSFARTFGIDGHEDSADAEAIVRAAHKLGDHYERLLELAEDCRMYSVPAPYADLVADCAAFLNQALHDFGRFVNDVLQRLDDVQRQAVQGRPGGAFVPVPLNVTTDRRLAWSMLDRLQDIG